MTRSEMWELPWSNVTIGVLIRVCKKGLSVYGYRPAGYHGALTEMNVPGRKKSVTMVMIRMFTVSLLVCSAIKAMFFVMSSILRADSWAFSANSRLASILRYCRMR